EQRRLAAARRLPRVALDDVSAVQQLLDQQADRAAPQLHVPREVGVRDRLMAADERQRDLTVDLARRGPGRDAEAVRVDAAHLSQVGPNEQSICPKPGQTI